MHLVLTLPGLVAQVADRVVHAPHIARLLAAAGPPTHKPDGLDDALAAYYGIEHASGTDCPLAPVRLAGVGVDPDTAFWLRADPVTLVAGRDDVRLTGTVRDLAVDDAAALIAMLNAHFESDGIVFVAARPDAWFVRAPVRVALLTRPVAAVAGRMLRDLLPTGPDAGTWRRWQNEIQMLLHQHPVNAARERDGKAPANSLWFSEGGTMPPRSRIADGIRTFANDGVATALAVYADSPARPVPEALHAAQAAADDAATTVVALHTPLDLDAVEHGWAAPAWTALVERKLDAVTMLVDGGDEAFAWTARRPTLRQRIALHFARHDLATLLAMPHASA